MLINEHVCTPVIISAWLSEDKCTLLRMHDYGLVPPLYYISFGLSRQSNYITYYLYLANHMSELESEFNGLLTLWLRGVTL